MIDIRSDVYPSYLPAVITRVKKEIDRNAFMKARISPVTAPTNSPRRVTSSYIFFLVIIVNWRERAVAASGRSEGRAQCSAAPTREDTISCPNAIPTLNPCRSAVGPARFRGIQTRLRTPRFVDCSAPRLFATTSAEKPIRSI